MSRILVVEDENTIADAILYALREDGMQADHCLLGRPALDLLRAGGYDAVILDVGLPDLTGFEVCRELRAFSDLPVIFLTARQAEIDRVLGLELGGDDYVTKPFSPRELVARVHARLRRGGMGDGRGWREAGSFAHDPQGQRIRFSGQLLSLTRYEYRLLAVLLARPGAILSREQLMDDVWRDAPETVDRTVDTHVKTLRAKLRQASAAADPIRTHRGLGYSVDTGH